MGGGGEGIVSQQVSLFNIYFKGKVLGGWNFFFLSLVNKDEEE